eukprot:SAG31_NODE_12367_length_947_cov_0.801887_1_plen_109_part_00
MADGRPSVDELDERRPRRPRRRSFIGWMDVRDGRELPGIIGAMAVYRKLNGSYVFTGLIQTPPSPIWSSIGSEVGFARPHGVDIEGPCVMITPDDFMAEMSKYDDFGQ